MKAKLKVTIHVEVDSEYDSIDAIIDELSSESYYTIESTDCVTVLDTEYMDTELISVEKE